MRFGRHVSADNLVLVVLRGENARHRVVSVAHISLAAAIIFTPLSPRARSPPHESPRTRRVHFTLPSRTVTTPPQSASTVARAPSRAHRDRAETPNRSVRSPGPSTPSRPPHRATTASPRHRATAHNRTVQGTNCGHMMCPGNLYKKNSNFLGRTRLNVDLLFAWILFFILKLS